MIFEMDVHAKSPAFENSEMGSEQTFRAILKAMVQPGQLVKIKNKLFIAKLLNAASAAVCLTLLNAETPIWTDLSWDSSGHIIVFKFIADAALLPSPVWHILP